MTAVISFADERFKASMNTINSMISRMDNAHGSHGGYNNNPSELSIVSHGTLTTEQAPEQETGATTGAAAAYMSALQLNGAVYFAYSSE